MTTHMKLRVSGFCHVDVSYVINVDVPDEYLGREIEYVEDVVKLPELATLKTAPHALALTGVDGVWSVDAAKFIAVFADTEVTP